MKIEQRKGLSLEVFLKYPLATLAGIVGFSVVWSVCYYLLGADIVPAAYKNALMAVDVLGAVAPFLIVRYFLGRGDEKRAKMAKGGDG